MARRLFDYGQPHSLNAAVSWKGRRWQLGGRFQLYSGLPYTSPTGAVFDSDKNSTSRSTELDINGACKTSSRMLLAGAPICLI